MTIHHMIFSKKEKQVLNENNFAGSYSVVLEIGEITIQLESEDDDFSRYIRANYLHFESSKPAIYLIRFYKYNKKLKWDNIETDNHSYQFMDFDERFFYRLHKQKNELDIVLPETYKSWEIDNVLKMYFSSISLNHNMILLHTSAIVKDGKAILFTGQSGAGKSTIAGLSELPLIHDDIIALSITEDSKFHLRTIPFKVHYENRNFTGEIAGFYRIIQDKTTYVENIPKNEQLVHLLFSVWNFDKFKRSETENRIMDYCLLALKRFSVKKLYFTKTNDFLKHI